jgi:hypothetical protein
MKSVSVNICVICGDVEEHQRHERPEPNPHGIGTPLQRGGTSGHNRTSVLPGRWAKTCKKPGEVVNLTEKRTQSGQNQ